MKSFERNFPKKYKQLKQKRMTRSFKVLFSSVLGAAMLVSVSSIALAAVTVKDAVAPSDVDKLTAMSGDASVALSWPAATDNVAVKGYNVYFGNDEVTSDNTAKYSNSVDVGNVTKYTVKKLQNGKKYFFAVTAYDAAKNESESYSPYAGAVPMSGVVADAGAGIFGKTSSTVVAANGVGGPDVTAPTVAKAFALNKNQVRVTFSEVVKLPTQDADKSFTVQDNYTYENLKVKSVTLDAEDKTGMSFILETDEQNPGSEYIATAGIQIEDIAGNPINSGTSDTATFTGSPISKEDYIKLHPAAPAPAVDTKKDAAVTKGEDKLVASADAATPKDGDLIIKDVKVENDTTIKVSLSKASVFSIDPSANFVLTKKGDDKNPLELSGVFIDDNKMDVLVTTTLEPGVEYTLTAKDIVDADGKGMVEGKNTFDFKNGDALVPVSDTTPPEEVTNLVVSALKNLGAKLKWTGSKNSAGDLLNYVVYHSTDDKTYGALKTLAKENTAFEASTLTPGVNYFKITSKDANGNESKGKTVKIKIVETGPEIGLIAIASVGLGRLFGKKKKAKVAKK